LQLLFYQNLGVEAFSMPDLAYINHDQQIVELTEARLPVWDRGFLFADSVYEVIRVYKGKAFRYEDHMERLKHSLKEIRLDFAVFHELEVIIKELIKQSGYTDAKIYIQITRGIAPRNHAFPEKTEPTLLVTIEKAKSLPESVVERGVKIISSEDIRWSRCDVKTTALLPNVLKKQLALEQGAYEVVFIGPDNKVRECSHCNIFMYRDGLVTPPESQHILSGITRKVILEIAERLKIKSLQVDFGLEALKSASEVFVTGSLSEIVPVVEIDDSVAGNGRPGPITKLLIEEYRKITREQY